MKKYSKKWKLKTQRWLQVHTDLDGLRVYQHYIQYDTEYSTPTGYKSLRAAVAGGMRLIGYPYDVPSPWHVEKIAAMAHVITV